MLGLYVCLIATIAHRHTTLISGINVPWGLPLALIGAYAIARAINPWVWLGTAFFGFGWAVGLIAPMFSPGDSYLLAQDWLGLSFMFGGLGAMALAVIRGPRTP